MVLPCSTMTRAPTTSFRFAPGLLHRLDAYAPRLSAKTGVPVARAAAAAKLLTEALDRETPALPDAAMQKRGTERHPARGANTPPGHPRNQPAVGQLAGG